jgi:cytochrome bd ubiquinol oxidase subunit II
MSGATDYLALLWAAVTAAAILAYILTDGWVQGVGILYPLVARQTDRDLLLESIVPLWKANEIWLILGAVLLLIGFPTAYSLLLTQLYFPIVALLFALVVRGASHAFRYRGGELRRIWALAFAGGSILATLAQGYLVGRLIEGAGGDDVTSGWIGWVRQLFPIICGFGLLGGYGLLGASWLISKADGALQVMGREVSPSSLILTATVMVAVCVCTPLVSPHVAHRWFGPSMRIVLVLFVATAAVIFWQLWTGPWRKADHRPLQWAAAFLVIAFAGVAISLYPYIVPYQFTFYDLANDPTFLKFAGLGLCVVLPVFVLYLARGYRSRRGKIRRTDIPVAASPALASRKTCGNNVDLHLS